MLAAQGLPPIHGPLLDVPYRSPDAERLLNEPRWKQQVARLREEFDAYRPHEIIAASLATAASHAATDLPVYGETS